MHTISSCDVCLWPDGTWCYYGDLHEMTHMSDDYKVVVEGSTEWYLTTGFTL